MQKLQMQAGVIPYVSTISACEKGRQCITAVALLREMQRWVQVDVITGRAIIKTCENGQQCEAE